MKCENTFKIHPVCCEDCGRSGQENGTWDYLKILSSSQLPSKCATVSLLTVTAVGDIIRKHLSLMLPWPGAGAHIPAWPDMHMMVFLAYVAVRILYIPLISALNLGPLCVGILEWQLKLCFLITPPSKSSLENRLGADSASFPEVFVSCCYWVKGLLVY